VLAECRFGESRDGMDERDATLILAANKPTKPNGSSMLERTLMAQF